MRSWRQVLTQIGMPIAVLSFYFLIPLPWADAPIGSMFGGLIGLISLAFIGGVIFRELRTAQRHLRPIHLLLAFELALLVFALIYYMMRVRNPGEFDGLDTRLDALYFSMVTTSTVGYGDIHAVGQAARAVVTTQIAFNLVFVAGIVALVQAQVRARTEARIASRAAHTDDAAAE